MKKICCIMLVFVLISLTGCESLKRRFPSFGPFYPFDNYHVNRTELLKVSRVLVLPLSNSTESIGASGEVTDIFVKELNKLGRFDVVTTDIRTYNAVSERLTKNKSYNLSDLRAVCDAYRVDAVIMGDIKSYRPYRPFILGMKLSMMRADTGRTIWVIDEIVDSSMEDVANAAKEYYRTEIDPSAFQHGREIVKASISMYTQFVCSSMVVTLNGSKVKKR